MQPYPDSMESVGFGGPERKNQYVAQQQAQESLFLEELTQRLSQMGPSSSSQQGELSLMRAGAGGQQEELLRAAAHAPPERASAAPPTHAALARPQRGSFVMSVRA